MNRTIQQVAMMMLALGLSAAPACGDKQYEQDLNKVCNALELSGAKDISDPSERAMKIASWLQSEIKSDKAMKLMRSMGSMTPSSRGAKLHSEASKAGLKGCPLADES